MASSKPNQSRDQQQPPGVTGSGGWQHSWVTLIATLLGALGVVVAAAVWVVTRITALEVAVDGLAVKTIPSLQAEVASLSGKSTEISSQLLAIQRKIDDEIIPEINLRMRQGERTIRELRLQSQLLQKQHALLEERLALAEHQLEVLAAASPGTAAMKAFAADTSSEQRQREQSDIPEGLRSAQYRDGDSSAADTAVTWIVRIIGSIPTTRLAYHQGDAQKESRLGQAGRYRILVKADSDSLLLKNSIAFGDVDRAWSEARICEGAAVMDLVVGGDTIKVVPIAETMQPKTQYWARSAAALSGVGALLVMLLLR